MSSIQSALLTISKPGTNPFIDRGADGAASELRLYYHATDISRTASSVRFPLASAHFSQLLSDRSSSSLQPLNRRTDNVSSNLSERSTVVAVGAGLRTRIELPYLDQFDRPERFVFFTGDCNATT